MGKKKGSKLLQDRKYHHVSRAMSDGKAVFRSSLQTDDKAVLQLGVFSTAAEAAKAADLATLAFGRKGPLNFVKHIYLQRDVDKERERLKQLGVLRRQPNKRKAGRSKEQAQQQQQATSQHGCGKPQGQHQHELQLPKDEEQQQDWTVSAAEAAAGGSEQASRKRKAASPAADTAAVSHNARDQQQRVGAAAAAEVGRPKRRRVQPQQGAADSPSAVGEPAEKPRKARSRHTSPEAAALTAPEQQPAPVSTAVVPAAQHVLPTGGAVPMDVQKQVSQERLLGQLHSALTAHEYSKRQLRAALRALEDSAVQLASLARVAGLQM